MEDSFLGTKLSPVVDGVSVVALGETLRMETVLPLLLVRGHCAVQVMAALRNLVIGLLRLWQTRSIAAVLRALAGSPRRALTLATSHSPTFRRIMK